MPTETTAATETTTPTTAAPAAATPPPETPPPAADDAETKALKAEALKAAAEARNLKTRLATLERERAERDKQTAAEREAEAKLLEEDPGAWLEKRAGMTRAEIHRRLTGKAETPDVAAQREIAALKAKLEEVAQGQSAKYDSLIKAQQEASEANAYRTVLGVAKSGGDDPALALAAQEIAADPRASGRWVTAWAEKEWPKYAAENGLDPSDPNEAARAAAKVIGEKALARAKSLVQNPVIAKALGLGAQSQQPPASQGNSTRTITSALAGERGPGTPDKPLSTSEREAQHRKAAERKALELLSSKG